MDRKKTNICLATYYDKSLCLIGKLCHTSLKNYANRYKYDIEVYNRPLTDRPPHWNKILIVQELFKHNYDFVFWIDADAIFVRFDIDIASEIEEGKDLYLAKFIGYDEGEKYEVPNTGIFLIRNSLWSKDILKRLWNCEIPKECRWKDQAAFTKLFGLVGLNRYNPLFKKEELRNKEPDSELLKKVKWISLEWNNWEQLAGVKNPIINHYAGQPQHVRMRSMMNDAIAAGLIPRRIMPKYIIEYHRHKLIFYLKKYANMIIKHK